MKANTLQSLLASAGNDQDLFDEYNHISYRELESFLDIIYDVSNDSKLPQSVCLCIQMENFLIAVIWLVFLIKENINFLLVPKSGNIQDVVPDFCDNVLTFNGTKISNSNLSKSFTLFPNTKYCKSKNALKVRAGGALLMSSGTTGEKKFIYFENKNLIGNAKLCVERFKINAKSKILVPVPINHMFGLGVGALTSLIAGASLSLISNNNIIKLYDKINSFKPTIILTTPALLKMMLTLNKRINNNSTFIAAGEALSQEIAEAFIKKFGTLCNLYGSTEMGAIGTSGNLKTFCSDLRIGIHALKGVKLKIDENDMGELLCKHPAAFSYYLNKLGVQSGKESNLNKWYPTKDLARKINNNDYLIEGRKDNCINRSGYLFSLETLEKTLTKFFSDVSRTIVIYVEIESMLKLIALFEVDICSQKLNSDDVRIICKRNLKKYMIPDHFYFIKKLPCLENGKPDRIFIKQNYSLIIKQTL